MVRGHEDSLIQPPEGLQFGLQFSAVRRRTRRTGQARWSSLNRSGPLRPELLMRHTVRRGRAATPPDLGSKQQVILFAIT